MKVVQVNLAGRENSNRYFLGVKFFSLKKNKFVCIPVIIPLNALQN